MKKIFSFLFVALSCFGFQAKVTSVSDGDTITVLHEGKKERIRFNGIDTPESDQPFGQEAKKFLNNKVFNKMVDVEVKTTDRYGRLVADIYIDNLWVNKGLVEEGYAWHYKRYSKDKRLADAEDVARSNKKGLWAYPNPIPPWDWRRGTRNQETSSKTASIEKAHWLNTASGIRHNSSCRWFKNTKNGKPCTATEGKACGICGG